MPLRPGHGNGAGTPHIEVPILRCLPQGIPGPALATGARYPRDIRGRVRSPEEAREIGRLGGLAKASKARALKILQGLGLQGCSRDELIPYYREATEFGLTEVERLAQVVGGGHCGAAPASMIQSAALQLAASRKLFAEGDFALASRLADASRQNLLAAHECCAREAMARRDAARDRPQGSPLVGLLEGKPK